MTYGKADSGLGYYDMPYNVKEATEGGKWVKVDEDKTLYVDIYAQPEDPRVMLLFDKKGTIAGIRMAVSCSQETAVDPSRSSGEILAITVAR